MTDKLEDKMLQYAENAKSLEKKKKEDLEINEKSTKNNSENQQKQKTNTEKGVGTFISFLIHAVVLFIFSIIAVLFIDIISNKTNKSNISYNNKVYYVSKSRNKPCYLRENGFSCSEITYIKDNFDGSSYKVTLKNIIVEGNVFDGYSSDINDIISYNCKLIHDDNKKTHIWCENIKTINESYETTSIVYNARIYKNNF